MGVGDDVGVAVAVGVAVGVGDDVGVAVAVGVDVGMGDGVGVAPPPDTPSHPASLAQRYHAA